MSAAIASFAAVAAPFAPGVVDGLIHEGTVVTFARQFVATPDRSSHVTGEAADIAPVDAQFWLIEHGAEYGICQTYANERWHFELATRPGGECAEMGVDASG